MGTIISSGVGSGFDVAGIVDKLVEAEGKPKTLQLDKEEAKVQGKLSALGTLRSTLASFRDTLATLKNLDRFQGRQVTLSAPEFVAASAGTAAVPGSYSIDVVQLAAAHKLQTAPSAHQNATTAVGVGTLHIATGGQDFDVVIDSTNNTLTGIAAAINASAAGAHVQATVLTGANEARLTIASRTIGADGAIEITQTGDLTGLVYPAGGGLVQIQGALDAEAVIDGITVQSATNTFSNAIPGVDVTLTAVNGEDDPPTQITVGYDRATARKTIEQLVKSYNELLDAIKSVSSYNAETQQGGPLFGDAGVRNIGFQLRRELTASVAGLSGSFDMLADIGISADLNGQLSIDAADLDAAFNTNFDAVGELFAADGVGVAVKLDRVLAPYLDSNGVLDARTTGLKTSIAHINERRDALADRLAALQARYTREFNALDTLVAQLQSTGNFLTQQLNQLPGWTTPSKR